MNKAYVAVTGATGFIGRKLSTELVSRGYNIRPLVRSSMSGFGVPIGDIASCTDWSLALENVDYVVHTAARVHVMADPSEDSLEEYRRVNVGGTLRLAQHAAERGVKRFVFVSSVKVNGEQTAPGYSYSAEDEVEPQDPYGISKWEAEQGLSRISSVSGMEVVIIRPPLVYGPGVKANFFRMMSWLYQGIPLPLGAIHNRRSLVALDNLADLIVTCIAHPAAANQVFLVSDGEDLSTTELLRRTASAMGKRARLLPVPQQLLEYSLKLAGKGDLAQRLCGSLRLDIGKTKELLGWTPPVSVDEALKRTAEDYLARR